MQTYNLKSNMFECIKRLIFRYYYNSRRILSEDLLILIFDYLPIEGLIELKKVSPQFSYCVKELLKRKRFLVVCENRSAFQGIFYVYHKFNRIEENKEILKNSVIRLEQMERKGGIICHKFVSKRCQQLNVLAINHQIKGKQIKALNAFSRRVDTLCLGNLFLSYENIETIESKIEKIGAIFGNTIICLYLKFANHGMDTTPKLIALLKQFPKLEELKVIMMDSIDEVVQYIPKTITSFGYI